MSALHLIRNLMRQWIERILEVSGIPEMAVEQHRAIYDAIRNRDTAALERNEASFGSNGETVGRYRQRASAAESLTQFEVTFRAHCMCS